MFHIWFWDCVQPSQCAQSFHFLGLSVISSGSFCYLSLLLCLKLLTSLLSILLLSLLWSYQTLLVVLPKIFIVFDNEGSISPVGSVHPGERFCNMGLGRTKYTGDLLPKGEIPGLVWELGEKGTSFLAVEFPLA